MLPRVPRFLAFSLKYVPRESSIDFHSVSSKSSPKWGIEATVGCKSCPPRTGAVATRCCNESRAPRTILFLSRDRSTPPLTGQPRQTFLSALPREKANIIFCTCLTLYPSNLARQSLFALFHSYVSQRFNLKCTLSMYQIFTVSFFFIPETVAVYRFCRRELVENCIWDSRTRIIGSIISASSR